MRGDAGPAPAAQRRILAPARYDLAGTVGALMLGRADPTARIDGREFWRASRTPDGPGTVRLRHVVGASRAASGTSAAGREPTGSVPADSELVATGYGPGGRWLAERADALAGLRRHPEAEPGDQDDFTEVAARHPVTAQLATQRPGLMLPRSERVFQELLATVLQQKVTWVEAARAYSAVVRHFGEPAPGGSGVPAGLLLPPDPATVAAVPYWVFHPLGVERRRADIIRRAASVAARLEETVRMSAADAARRLRAIDGIGPWTVGELGRLAYGDPDAVSLGDFHLPHQVAYALAGERRASDERMLQLLEPFAGHRGRVIRLIVAAGRRQPRRAPRAPVRTFTQF